MTVVPRPAPCVRPGRREIGLSAEGPTEMVSSTRGCFGSGVRSHGNRVDDRRDPRIKGRIDRVAEDGFAPLINEKDKHVKILVDLKA